MAFCATGDSLMGNDCLAALKRCVETLFVAVPFTLVILMFPSIM